MSIGMILQVALVAVIIGANLFLALAATVFRKKWGHDIMGWHDCDKAKAALSAPPRNCDRPECATTKAAQEVWHREDGGKTAYYEWLLATYKEGGNDGR